MLYNIYVHIIYLLSAHILEENILLLIVYIHIAWTVTHIVLKAKFLVPGLGDKVDSGVGLSYRTGPLGYIGWRAGDTYNPMPELTTVLYIPHPGNIL